MQAQNLHGFYLFKKFILGWGYRVDCLLSICVGHGLDLKHRKTKENKKAQPIKSFSIE
jgi:hypothetical protein